MDWLDDGRLVYLDYLYSWILVQAFLNLLSMPKAKKFIQMLLEKVIDWKIKRL